MLYVDFFLSPSPPNICNHVESISNTRLGCDNAVRNGGGPASDGSAQCNMACSGNAVEICGGPNRLDLYTFGF